jgi:hypothetical protein
MLSEALAARGTVPLTVPGAGDVMETLGLVVSAATVRVISFEGGPTFPFASRALTTQ